MVPETATWGMLLAGFDMIGAAMRTRRPNTAVSFA
ncbi:PEPxxWA-CTERM sorting domain-containing protein [Sphingomonas aliaeris]|nr:PEPxxWA-CTERM sorting domain-containing protein [Sphingomonas aliaeris]